MGNIPSIAYIALSQILKLMIFGGLETNHKCMNIFVVKKCVSKLPIFCIKLIISLLIFMNHALKRLNMNTKQTEKLLIVG